jgi:glutaminase
MDYQHALEHAASVGRIVGNRERVPTYIPALNNSDHNAFGLALVTIDGQVFGVGDYLRPFSTQSITKLFALALVLRADSETFWDRVKFEPSAEAFNSLCQLERDAGVPCNPFVNAGALVVTDRLLELTGDSAEAVLGFLRTESGRPDLSIDPVVVESELANNARNTAITYLLADLGALRNPVDVVLKNYTRQCGIEANCLDLAQAGLFLARHGLRNDGSRLLSPSLAKRLNALMLIGGMYGGMAQVAYRIGLPAKSGVGGGVLAIIPGHGALCAWSPDLDNTGNSLAGTAALEAFTTVTGLSIF